MADGTHVADPWEKAEILSLFNPEAGMLDRLVHSDKAIHRLD